MLQARVGFGRQISPKPFRLQQRYFGSSTTNGYLNSVRSVLEQFKQQFISKPEYKYTRRVAEKKPLKKHSHELRTILERNRKMKLPVEGTPDTLTQHGKRSKNETLGFLRDFFSKLTFWNLGLYFKARQAPPLMPTKINYYPTKPSLRSNRLGLTQREEKLRASRSAKYLEKKFKSKTHNSAARATNFIPIDLSKMKVMINPAKGIESARFVPLSKLISQTPKSLVKNGLLRTVVAPKKTSKGPIKVKAAGTCRIFVCQSTKQCDEAIEMLRKSIRNFVTPYLGFDTESTRYRLGSQVSVIQLASSDICVIFQVSHIYRSTGKIPASLRELLADANILKTGVNATGDAASLWKTYRLACHGIINIDSIAQELGYRNLSLADLVYKFGVNVNLDKSWRKKRWSRTHLTIQEIDYAANDAIASFHLFNALIRRSFRAA